mmetsp:Transcript_40582/g.117317  ORF Transcript_40582/g.117317 Transcript_40582/m.117317 type:complete len:270 (-) Transcript_40582:233-1042(-)
MPAPTSRCNVAWPSSSAWDAGPCDTMTVSKPTSSTASLKASTVVMLPSNNTDARSSTRFTEALSTPTWARKHLSTVPEHAEHVMPLTRSSTRRRLAKPVALSLATNSAVSTAPLDPSFAVPLCRPAQNAAPRAAKQLARHAMANAHHSAVLAAVRPSVLDTSGFWGTKTPAAVGGKWLKVPIAPPASARSADANAGATVATSPENPCGQAKTAPAPEDAPACGRLPGCVSVSVAVADTVAPEVGSTMGDRAATATKAGDGKLSDGSSAL